MKFKLARRFIAIFFTLCMMLLLCPPRLAFATEPKTESQCADFTDGDGKAALAILNKAKTEGAEDSTWDGNCLTLKGIDFTTSATTAIILPKESTIVLAENTKNQIKSGDANINATGTHSNKIYICCISTMGDLTIEGTGELSVTSGDHINTGNAWTYTSGILAGGNINIKSGTVTAIGGKAISNSTAFSCGVEMEEGSSLFVTGGILNAIGGESINTEDNEESKSFSRGIEVYKGDVSVSGKGKLNAKCVPAMDGEGLEYGIYASVGSLNVSDEAVVNTDATRSIYISNGNLVQTGGTVTATHEVGTDGVDTGYSIDVDISTFAGVNNLGSVGNIKVSGGTLKTVNGNVGMSSYNAKEGQGSFTVSGGKVDIGSVYDAAEFNVSGGTVNSQRISSKSFTLTNGNVTIREPVYKHGDEKLRANCAFSSRKTTINGGKLDVAWDWGKYTPILLSDDSYSPLVRFYDGDTIAFNGGTSIFNTGCAGNVVFQNANIILGGGMVETGADSEQKQKESDVPVVFYLGNVIKEVEFDKAATDSYEIGDVPKATAVSCDENSENYYFHECWEELKETDKGLEPVAYWYSDGDAMALLADDKKITSFENGKKYLYSIRAIAKGNYVFFDEDALKVKLNGEDISNTASVTVSGGNKYLQITGKTIDFGFNKYKILDGANSEWKRDEEGGLTFRVDGDITKFVGIKVDDEWVDEENYEVESGSTVVSLKNEYLKTLPEGEHKITFVYTDGEVSTNFEIKETEKISENSSNPQTGDNSNILIWISVLMILSASGIIAITIYDTKKGTIKVIRK